MHKLTGGQQIFMDFFRILAALFVVVGHSFSFYQITALKNQDYFPYIQNIGVVMLFLLSGFLTAYSLTAKNQNRDYKFPAFVKHKAIRIAGEYLPALALIAFIDYLAIKLNGANYGYHASYNVKQFLGNLFMLQDTAVNYIPKLEIVPFGSGRPLWTLSIEWWLYLLFAYIFLIMVNRETLTLKKSFLFFVLLLFPTDYIITGRGGGLGFVFLLGVLAYYIHGRITKKAALCILPFSVAAYILYGLAFKEAYTVPSFLLLWTSFCSCLKIAESWNVNRNAVLAFLSQSTFMLYLIHYSIIDLIYNADIAADIYCKFAAGIGFSILLSLVMYSVFGKHIRAVIQKALPDGRSTS